MAISRTLLEKFVDMLHWLPGWLPTWADLIALIKRFLTRVRVMVHTNSTKIPIRLSAFHCNDCLIHIFKTDVAKYLRLHGFQPDWIDEEQAGCPGTALTVTLFRPQERLNTAEVLRSVQTLINAPGTQATVCFLMHHDPSDSGVPKGSRDNTSDDDYRKLVQQDCVRLTLDYFFTAGATKALSRKFNDTTLKALLEQCRPANESGYTSSAVTNGHVTPLLSQMRANNS
eukprot:jgi/Ulvmu1/11513/UM078_0002.1